jgi:dienelactone hydrolase
MIRPPTTQHPIAPSLDLRDMLRQHLIRRSLDCMEQAAQRRQQALQQADLAAYQAQIRRVVAGFYHEFDFAESVQATLVSTYTKQGYRIENVLFDSFPGWQVNATVYVPLDYAPPYPAVIIPVGHSGKQFASYQLPAQFFARSGYLAVLFDPPGQASEKQPGNDHFYDGVRSYLVGETSSRYFVGDALRCIDYLETRSDTDLKRGVAMTGVSGGGTTTTLASVLDDRITVTGPSCCLSPRAALDIVQSYAGCPETHMWRRYADGLDEVDLLCGIAPKPTLLMAGREDEVFRIEDTMRLAHEVAAFYAAFDAPEQFEFFIDAGGHAYTLEQARQFTCFMNRWLIGQPERALSDLPDERFLLDPYEELRCYPDTAVNIRTLSLDRARRLAVERTERSVLSGVRDVIGIEALPNVPEAQTGQPFRVWTHEWQQVLLKPETGIELPATFLSAGDAVGTILHIDDRGRHRLLQKHGPLLRAADFLERDSTRKLNILSVDLRGWGDSEPALYPYELAGWGGVDRILSYMSAALGDGLLAQRVRDALAALAYLRTRVDSSGIIVTGSGLGGVVALHVAALAPGLRGAVTWETLASFEQLLAAENYTWPADAFLPQVLRYYDLPELAAALPCPVYQIHLLDATGQTIAGSEGDYVQALKGLVG